MLTFFHLKMQQVLIHADSLKKRKILHSLLEAYNNTCGTKVYSLNEVSAFCQSYIHGSFVRLASTMHNLSKNLLKKNILIDATYIDGTNEMKSAVVNTVWIKNPFFRRLI